MLCEIRCEKFRKGPVRFHPGLNVVLGDEKATNSIGKSTMLMIVDFAFGGDGLIRFNKDIVVELGHHDYLFVFEFAEGFSYFRRGTSEPGTVYVCDAMFEVNRPISVEEYTSHLKQAYNVDLPDISFRALVNLHARVWGKENLLVDRPLHAVPAQRGADCVDNLLKTYGRFGEIRESSKALKVREAKVAALRAAQRHQIAPKVTKTAYNRAQERIGRIERDLVDIRDNLSRYATNLSAIVNSEILDLKLRKDDLLRVQMHTAGRLKRIERNLTGSKAPPSRGFQELKKFFPDVDLERLGEVDAFHSGVATILRSELKKSQEELVEQLNHVNAALRDIDVKMANVLGSVEQPGVIIDRVFELASALQSAKSETAGYESVATALEAVQDAKTALEEQKALILDDVGQSVNEAMRAIANDVLGANRKSPRLSLRDGGYAFEVYDDTGTGAAYIGLVLFDLAVFLSTPLPVLVHDSILFKNIQNDSVSELLRIYMGTSKQSFIALDEIQKYGEVSVSLLVAHQVIQVRDDEVLYVKDWRQRQ